MGKTRDLFRKIRDAKETFHAKMGSIKGISMVTPVFSESFSRLVLRYILFI